MTRVVALGLLVLAVPAAAWACPGCMSSAFGDRTYGWAYLSLLAAPFAIGSGIAGVMAYCYWRPRRPGEMEAASAPAAVSRNVPPIEKETT
jgi:hypothetical protein